MYLELLRLKCLNPEDYVGADEVYISVNHDRVWGDPETPH